MERQGLRDSFNLSYVHLRAFLSKCGCMRVTAETLIVFVYEYLSFRQAFPALRALR